MSKLLCMLIHGFFLLNYDCKIQGKWFQRSKEKKVGSPSYTDQGLVKEECVSMLF